ncbi:calcium-binding protein [Jannaschia formosa]|uniref:calcium-binding protein n=1 Tax=Jannaschia formosa TaxID=2259592 RepID=UPI000E1C3363|nr:calcium-binding protein [Jannaschia formosa]TFL18303.1 calcium-binding protein [Jannaschia formosa]
MADDFTPVGEVFGPVPGDTFSSRAPTAGLAGGGFAAASIVVGGIDIAVYDDGAAETAAAELRAPNVQFSVIRMAGLPDGGFVLLTEEAVLTQPYPTTVQAYRFDADGTRLGGPIRVFDDVAPSNPLDPAESRPAVAQTASGFVVAAGIDGILHTRAFDGAARPVGPSVEYQTAREIRLAEVEGGGAWLSYAGPSGLILQELSASGARTGDPIRLPTASGSSAVLDQPGDGLTVVYDGSAFGGSSFDVFGQRVLEDGTLDGAPYLINEYLPGPQVRPVAGVLPDGRSVVAWIDRGDRDGEGGEIYGRLLGADGRPEGPEFRANSEAERGQDAVSLSVLDNGDVLVSWTESFTPPGSATQARAEIQRFSTTPTGPTEGDDELVGTPGPDLIEGLGGNDTLRGLGGDDTLDGGTGNDRMEGGAGDDTFLWADRGDRVIEAAGGGSDTIRATADVTLRGAEIEAVVLEGTGNHQVIGNGLAQEITGNAGRNILAGGGGGDLLTGGAGRDFFAFQVSDAPGGATILDFEAGDRLALDDRFFGLGDGSIDVREVTETQFRAAIRFGLADYDARTGELRIDEDGRRGPGEPVLIATIDGGGRLEIDDVLLF